ncbi:hypothetical protein BH11PLA2_BH11PLA2_49150 [soil metagenome]
MSVIGLCIGLLAALVATAVRKSRIVVRFGSREVIRKGLCRVRPIVCLKEEMGT